MPQMRPAPVVMPVVKAMPVHAAMEVMAPATTAHLHDIG
jgi:hypothetical protein